MDMLDRRSFLGGVVGSGALATVSGCLGSLRGSDGYRSAIGLPMPETGPLATAGRSGRRGVQIAFDEINEDRDEPITSVIEDGQGSPETAMQVSRNMLGDDIPVLTGTFSSDVSSAISTLAEQEQVPFMTAISGAPEIISEDDDYTFRMTGNDIQKVRGVGRFLEAQGDVSGVGIIAADYSMGRASLDVMKEYAETWGLTVEYESLVPLGTDDFVSELQRIDTTAIEALFYPFPGVNGPTLISQTRQQGLFDEVSYVIGNDSYGSEAYKEALGADIAGVYNWGVDLQNERSQRASRRSRDRYDVPMDTLSLPNYDAVHLLREVIDEAETVDPEAIRDVLADTTYETASGWSVEFDESGENQAFNMIVSQWQETDDGLRNEVVHTTDVIEP